MLFLSAGALLRMERSISACQFDATQGHEREMIKRSLPCVSLRPFAQERNSVFHEFHDFTVGAILGRVSIRDAANLQW